MFECILMLCKCRRIQNDQVIDGIHALKILESILGKCRMTGIAGEIILHSASGEFNGTCRTVNRVNQFGTASQSGE